MEKIKNLARALVIFGFFGGQPAWAVEPISAQDAAHLVEQGAAILVDVREREELAATGTAEPAVWLPISAVRTGEEPYRDFLARTDPSKALVFFCRSGRRAAWVAQHFKSLGFRTYNMGGFRDWQEAGLPIRELPF